MLAGYFVVSLIALILENIQCLGYNPKLFVLQRNRKTWFIPKRKEINNKNWPQDDAILSIVTYLHIVTWLQNYKMFYVINDFETCIKWLMFNRKSLYYSGLKSSH